MNRDILKTLARIVHNKYIVSILLGVDALTFHSFVLTSTRDASSSFFSLSFSHQNLFLFLPFCFASYFSFFATFDLDVDVVDYSL